RPAVKARAASVVRRAEGEAGEVMMAGYARRGDDGQCGIVTPDLVKQKGRITFRKKAQPMQSSLLSDLDLAALLCSRVCHDVISPVGAITNGLELLEVEDDEGMREMAMGLVKKSARQ